MPKSATGNSRIVLPGLNAQAESGKAKTIARPEPQAAPGNKSRKARIKEDIDPDYAEEAEDFFYGEGM
ncbi:MAG: hypothetical protein WAW02_11120 [Sideroxyarcus sp.]